ncbi:MAG TPA: Calx-beta domain-containing protein, partial [Pyrinomonadaceae bacterium]|nr:Calx-beta domain-containing protein [Pyrinomonadaceae bacterium]
MTPNDPADGDTGSNNLQNFPLITSVTSNAGQTTIAGTLNSTANTTFSVDFYSNAACDPSGNGEGAKPFSLNTGLVTTDANGNGNFNVVVPAALPAGRVITATATDPSGNTSEFSPCSSSDAMGSVRFDPASLVAIEDIGFIPVTVVRTGSIGSLSVNFATVDGTAKAGEDYVATSGTLTFAPGETTKTINVTILDNGPLEGTDESFSVILTNPTEPDVVDSPGIAVITLKDSIFIPTITLNNISVTEGNTGTTNATFTVSISEMTGKVVTVNYASNGQTAISGVDFQPVSGTLTFNARTTALTVSVPVIGDTLDEFDETFRLALSNFVNAAPVTSGLGRATILDDDASPALSISDVSVNEGNSGTTTAVFTVRMSVISAKAIQVTYATANGSASAGSDYVETTNTLVINAGQLEGTISVPVNGDTENETNETFLLNLTQAFQATILDGQGTATILNDDGTTVPLQLLLDESGPDPIQAAALDSMLLLRDPFPVVNNNSFMNPAPDRNTRVMLFVRNLQLGPGEPASSVVVTLVDGNNVSYDLPAEDVRPVQGVD